MPLQIIPVSGVLTGTAELQVSVPVELLPSTTYTSRLVVANEFEVSTSYTSKFTTFAAPDIATSPFPPAASAPAPAEITATPVWQVFLPALRRCPTDGF